MDTVTRPEQWLTVENVAWLLQVSKKTLYNQRYRGEPPGSLGVKLGGAVRFRAADLDAFIDSQRSNGPPKGAATASTPHPQARKSTA